MIKTLLEQFRSKGSKKGKKPSKTAPDGGKPGPHAMTRGDLTGPITDLKRFVNNAQDLSGEDLEELKYRLHSGDHYLDTIGRDHYIRMSRMMNEQLEAIEIWLVRNRRQNMHMIVPVRRLRSTVANRLRKLDKEYALLHKMLETYNGEKDEPRT